ncbi:unnamed protein product [Tetraodon nigroviridis]|uniref:(spotted green pufferfish) hypothetical protein n=1 Tax=Tetraodon nigroviridis TaxID=99883 RepID=Q4RXF4_TETNG|nr:unnamed protein product [Tetraodon nigroviridis]
MSDHACTMLNDYLHVTCGVDRRYTVMVSFESLHSGTFSLFPLHHCLTVRVYVCTGGCLLSVAVVKNSSLDISSLQGLRSCHSGIRWTAGWNLPLGFLLSRNYLSWSKQQPLSHGSFRDELSLLCADGTQAPLSHYRSCNLGRGPGAATVTRRNFRKVSQKFLSTVQMLFGRKGQEVQRFQLFESALFGKKDLLFRDATDRLFVLPENVDVSQVVGQDYVALLKSLRHEGADHRWCVVVNFYTKNSAAVWLWSPLFEAD